MGTAPSVLGHAYPRRRRGGRARSSRRLNFTRPAAIEVECAEQILELVAGAEMVKFAKNGSDATIAAVRLARAYTGRDMVAICADHPFFSSTTGSSARPRSTPAFPRRYTS